MISLKTDKTKETPDSRRSRFLNVITERMVLRLINRLRRKRQFLRSRLIKRRVAPAPGRGYAPRGRKQIVYITVYPYLSSRFWISAIQP